MYIEDNGRFSVWNMVFTDKRHRSSSSLAGAALESTRSERKLDIKGEFCLIYQLSTWHVKHIFNTPRVISRLLVLFYSNIYTKSGCLYSLYHEILMISINAIYCFTNWPIIEALSYDEMSKWKNICYTYQLRFVSL